MSNRTDNPAEVGKHKFELAGLGMAPFRFVSVSDNVVTYPDGTTKAGGSCDYCGTGIRTQCHIISSDGKSSKVGCNCIEKVGDAGLLKAYKTSPEFRRALREKTAKKNAEVFEELKGLIEKLKPVLEKRPHPYGFTDRKTGVPLTAFDQVQWLFQNSGAKGRNGLLRSLKKQFDNANVGVTVTTQ